MGAAIWKTDGGVSIGETERDIEVCMRVHVDGDQSSIRLTANDEGLSIVAFVDADKMTNLFRGIT